MQNETQAADGMDQLRLTTLVDLAPEMRDMNVIEALVRGDRTLLIQEPADTIAFWREQLPEYDEHGKTDLYWKRVAERHRNEIQRLEAMLRWAHSDSYMHTS